mmetsp:Transcript_36560/g.64080  ORF Transcript_36560/g.64080 Transcript_36560/m.64080 type:complete len:146 (+) Transcript_36560:57-494(+)
MDVSAPDWSTSTTTTKEPALGGDRSTSISSDNYAPSMSAAGMEISTSATSSQLTPSTQRTYTHRVYRVFKFITITLSLLLFIAQVISVIYLPFDVIELVLKIFLSSFSVLIILNELEWWGVLRDSPVLRNFIPRGYFYAVSDGFI